MKSEQKKSQVWLVSAEQNISVQGEPKIKKHLLREYESMPLASDEKTLAPFMVPVGYVIQHPEDQDSSSYYDHDGYMEKLYSHATPILTGSDVSHLEGELLTVIDASFSDKQQREAIKSIVRNTIWKFNGNLEKRVLAIYKSAQE